ncbi:MAG: hypothetical protein D6748_11405 [Calditrichaeota bacterium]|nr:MAG: hypothetical protein D6748_11405 [Calditrichota bacterium]
MSINGMIVASSDFQKNRWITMLKIKHYLFLAFTLLFLNCASSTWSKIDLTIREGDTPTAIQMVETYLQTHPQDARALFTLGELYASIGEWKLMREAFLRCQQVDIRYQQDVERAMESYWRRNLQTGIQQMEQHKYTEASNYFTNAIFIYPDRALSHRLKGEAAWAMKDTTNSIEEFQQVLNINAQDTISMRYLMRIYFLRGQYEETVGMATKLLSLVPEDIEALRSLAYSYDRSDQLDFALQAYQRLLTHSREEQDVLALAALLYRKGDYQQAIEFIQRAMRMGADSLSSLRALAQCQLMMEDYQQLKQTANEILKLDSQAIYALQLLQIAYAATGDKKQVNKIAQQIRDIQMEMKN